LTMGSPIRLQSLARNAISLIVRIRSVNSASVCPISRIKGTLLQAYRTIQAALLEMYRDEATSFAKFPIY
jgi:hypothetical protein